MRDCLRQFSELIKACRPSPAVDARITLLFNRQRSPDSGHPNVEVNSIHLYLR